MNSLATRAADGQLALSLANYGEIVKRPLALVPEPLRKPLLTVHFLTRHLKGLENPLPLATLLTVAMEREGLTLVDAGKILDSMSLSSAVATYEFPANVMTLLSRRIAEAVASNKAIREQQRRQQELAAASAESRSRSQVMSLAAAYGSGL